MKPIDRWEIPDEIIEMTGEIKDMDFPKQGYTSNVSIIKTEKGIYTIKRTKGERFSQCLNRECKVLHFLSKTDLPIPKVFTFVEQKKENQSWALFEFVEGQTLRSAFINETKENLRQELIFNFGKILSRIHQTQCPPELKDETKPWLELMLHQAEYNLMQYETEGTSELLEQLKKTKPEYYQQTLIHGDFTIDNVLVQAGTINGIIDWDGGTFGDPRYDVALAIRPKPNVFQSMKDIEIFFEGYGKRIITEKEYNYFADNGLYLFF